ncbi:MAG: DUF349 domain-containing protein [Owenweeksia sp.]|nr:DUF349 domain-containing protein [Owenweeksia sp.]
MWERFSEITHQIHNKREKHYGQLRQKADELIARKKELIKQLEEIPTEKIDAHHSWQEAIKEVDAIRQEFRELGRIRRPENDEIWGHFRSSLRQFNLRKNQFYKNLKKDHQENLEKKRELLAIAEELKDSEDWRTTTNEMKRIQAEWKRIGHVPKSESDKIWKQFRAACNHYFNRLTESNKEREKALEGNYDQKEKLLQKLREYRPAAGKQKESVKALKTIIQQWKAIGPVPRSKNNIEGAFNRELDKQFQSIDVDRAESQRIRFENKMESLTDQGGQRQLQKERNHLNRQIDEARKELGQLETNLSFFSSSNPENPLLKEAEKNIQKQREQIELMEAKHKMLNVKIRKMKKEQEAVDAKKEENHDPAESKGKAMD